MCEPPGYSQLQPLKKMKTISKCPLENVRLILSVIALWALAAYYASAQTPVKIMPLGDSITFGAQRVGNPPGGYRKELGTRLGSAGISYDFVGESSENPAPGIDPNHNGYPGIRTDQVLAKIDSWLNKNPDIVLLKLGTNDMLQKYSVASAIGNLREMSLRITNNANRKLYVATIIPVNEDRDGYTKAQWAPIINTYNNEVRKMVQDLAGQGRKVALVDMYNTIVYTDPNNANNNFFLPSDGTHPGQAGYNQMGMIWYNAIRAGIPTTPPPPSGPQSLANGSFESDFAGWSVTGNTSILPYTAYGSTDGSKIVGFNGGNSVPNGVLSQTFATTAGTSYSLTFDAGVVAYNTSQQRLQVSVTGSGNLFTQVVALNGTGNGTRWARQTFSFIANSSSSTVTFRDQSTATQNIDCLLDNVRVAAGSSGGGNTAPVAASDSYTATQSTTLSVPAPGVLANDSDPQGNPMTAVLDDAPDHGSVTLSSNGSFTYTPASGYSGSDSFSYHARDGSLNSGIVTVGIFVDAPGSAVLANGGFESGFTSWNTGGNVMIASGGTYYATEGSKLVAFNAGNSAPNGTVSQTFATTAGQTYTLLFDAGVLSYNGASQSLLVTVTGSGAVLSRSVSIRGPGGGKIAWTEQTFSFTANSANSVVTFRDQSSTSDSIDLLLDDVRVTGGTSAKSAMADRSGGNDGEAIVIKEEGISTGDPIVEDPKQSYGDFRPGFTFDMILERKATTRTNGDNTKTDVPVPSGIPRFKEGEVVKFTIGRTGQLKGPDFSIKFIADGSKANAYSDIDKGSPATEQATIYKDAGKNHPTGGVLIFRKVTQSASGPVVTKVRYIFTR